MKAWEQFLLQQEEELGADTVNKWLRSFTIARFDACNLYLEARDSFQALWFEEHIRPKIAQALLNNNKKQIKVHLSIAVGEAQAAAKEQKGSKNKAPSQTPLPFAIHFDTIDPHSRFDNFILASANTLAYKILSSIAIESDPSLAFNPIYIYGDGGVGKTHLLMAAAQHLKQLGLKVIYTRAETFTQHVVAAIRAGEMNSVRKAYRNTDALIVDDVHIFARKTTTQEEFFHTFNTLHLEGKQLILSSNCSPQELQFIEPRLVSRFEWGIVLPVEPLNTHEQAQMLQSKAHALNHQLPPRLVEFLLNTFTNSTKSLTRALQALILRTHLDNGYRASSPHSLTVPQAKALLNDLILEEIHFSLTPEKIMQHVAEYYGILPEDILSKAQSRDCVLPRQLAMYFCRHELKMAFVKIGDLFSKDHSTVMASVKLIQKSIDNNDADIAPTVSVIRKKLRESPSPRAMVEMKVDESVQERGH